jgi:hypothetical protein
MRPYGLFPPRGARPPSVFRLSQYSGSSHSNRVCLFMLLGHALGLAPAPTSGASPSEGYSATSCHFVSLVLLLVSPGINTLTPESVGSFSHEFLFW